MKQIKSAACVLALLLMLCGCADKSGGITAVTDENGNIEYTDGDGNKLEISSDPVLAIDPDTAFSSSDRRTEYDPDEAECITLGDGDVTISDEGVYVFSGMLSGSITVNAEKTDKIRLVLAGVDVTANGTAALAVISADKVFVTLADGTENSLSSVGDFAETEEGIDAAVYSKEDITFNGTGSLSVTSETGHGIVSKDDVKFTGGKYEINAASHAVSANDRAYFADGEYIFMSGKDGIRAENSDDASLGLVYIAGGKYDITSDGDSIDGGAAVQIDGGEIRLIAGGGHENGTVQGDEFGFGGMGGFPGGMWEDKNEGTDEASVSTKGIKSDGILAVNGGKLNVDAADDALHAAGKVTVTGGDFAIETGDDGIHSDADLLIAGGRIDISTSYEGLEGVNVTVSGGEITLYASDDGINAAGGTSEGAAGDRPGGFGGMMEGDDTYGINILGGKMYVNASGDGVDSNGSFNVAGGEIYIDGPTNGGNGALDYGTSATATGGICVAVGAQGMASGFSSATQGAIIICPGGNAGDEITVTDADGNVILSYTPQKAFQSVVLTSPDITDEGEYTVTVGSSSTEIKMDGFIYGSSGGMGPGGFGSRPDGGGRPDGGPGGRPR